MTVFFLGPLGIAVGFYIFVTRYDWLRVGDYHLSYILHWFAIGAGSMVGGVFTLVAGSVSFSYIMCLVAALAYLAYQRRQGIPWHPPAHAVTRPSTLEETV